MPVINENKIQNIVDTNEIYFYGINTHCVADAHANTLIYSLKTQDIIF